MGLFRNRSAAPLTDPMRTTWRVEMTGRCCGGHQCSTTIDVSEANGTTGAITSSGQCGACGSDVDLTGWVG